MNTELAGRKAAEKFRRSQGLGAAPITDLVKTIEETTECKVAILTTSPPYQHGTTIRDPRSDVEIIAVSDVPDFLRQRLSLAHQFGHWFFDTFYPEASNDLLDTETRADAFTRHLLIPQSGVKQCLANMATTAAVLPVLSQVVRSFLVPPKMALVALREVGFVSDQTKRDLSWLGIELIAEQFGWADEYTKLQADAQQRHTPQLLLGRAILDLQEGEELARTIAALKEFEGGQ
jgi:hypothetical protein